MKFVHGPTNFAVSPFQSIWVYTRRNWNVNNNSVFLVLEENTQASMVCCRGLETADRMHVVLWPIFTHTSVPLGAFTLSLCHGGRAVHSAFPPSTAGTSCQRDYSILVSSLGKTSKHLKCHLNYFIYLPIF